MYLLHIYYILSLIENQPTWSVCSVSYYKYTLFFFRKDDLSQSLEKAKKLLDVKAAIEKLRLRSIESEDGTGSEISTSSSESSNSSESDSEIAIAPVTAPKG